EENYAAGMTVISGRREERPEIAIVRDAKMTRLRKTRAIILLGDAPDRRDARGAVQGCGEFPVKRAAMPEAFPPEGPGLAPQRGAHQPLAGERHERIHHDDIVVAQIGWWPVHVAAGGAERETESSQDLFVSGERLLRPGRIRRGGLQVK